jgi:hypothetical protein
VQPPDCASIASALRIAGRGHPKIQGKTSLDGGTAVAMLPSARRELRRQVEINGLSDRDLRRVSE